MPCVEPNPESQLLSRKILIQNTSYSTSPPQAQLDPSAKTIGPCLPPQRDSTSRSLGVSERIDPGIITDVSKINEIQCHPQFTAQNGVQNDSNPHSGTYYLENSTSVTTENQRNSIKSSIDSSNMRRIFGPALPPVLHDELDSKRLGSDARNDNSTDSDDDYGPSLPPPCGKIPYTGVISKETIKEQSYGSYNYERLNSTSKLKRAEWMLTPPTSSDLTTRVDPTKLKSRKFTSGRGTKRLAEVSGISTIWTETPDEKRQRLEDEVLGRKDAISSLSSRKATITPSELVRGTQSVKEREATREQICEYNKQNRNKSLLEEHKAAQDRGELEVLDDDPSRRAFDKEKDMALGRRHINNANRKQLLMHATNFGDRFQEGKYL